MTIERRMIVGTDDIEAVTFQCLSCNTRATTPVSSLSEVPRQCKSCHAVWWRENEFASHVSTSQQRWLSFRQSGR
jgi:hypothetical protein